MCEHRKKILPITLVNLSEMEIFAGYAVTQEPSLTEVLSVPK